MTDRRPIKAGARIAYTGDVSNGKRDGVIQTIITNRWGVFALVRWDTSRMIGWERDGTPVEYEGDVFQEVPVQTIALAPQAGARFHLLSPEAAATAGDR